MLASFVGQAIALSPAIPAARFKLLALYDSINSINGWGPQIMVRLSNMGYRSLKYFWTQLTVSDCKSSWEASTPDELLFTDSSDFGYGAHLGQVHRDTLVSGLWPIETANQHITFKELKVIQVALEALGPALKQRNVTLFSDSASTVFVMQKLYTKSVSLRSTLGRIIALLLKY